MLQLPFTLQRAHIASKFMATNNMELDDPSKMVDIDETPPTPGPSTLFQVPLIRQDVLGYSRIPSQPLYNPMNCAAASAKLLGLVSPAKADEMTRLVEGVYTRSWENYLNANAPRGIVYTFQRLELTEEILLNVGLGIFPEFGTIILTAPVDGSIGHYYVLARDKYLKVGVLDPQNEICAMGLESIKNFIKRIHPGSSRLYLFVITVNKPRTISQMTDDFTEGILSRQVASMKIGSGGRSTRHRTSLPTRKVGRSSSSSKRSYTRRRRALQTGKVGYRPTKTGRKV